MTRLRAVAGDKYNAIWPDDPQIEQKRKDVEVLVTADHKVDSSVLAPWPHLKMVSLAFTGYDKVDRKYCRDHGLKVYYVPDYSSDSVAELTVGLALSVLRKIPRADNSARQGDWDKYGIRPGIELCGKKVGILGTGRIGSKSARLFQAFGCNVVGYARGSEKLEEILAASDIIILHLPANESTRHIINAERLALMKPTAILINTARSELVDTDALVAALKQNRIIGAGIDVFDEEPAPQSIPKTFSQKLANRFGGLFSKATSTKALLRLNNVVATPHIGFKTKEALQRLTKITIENIGNFVTGSEENLLPE